MEMSYSKRSNYNIKHQKEFGISNLTSLLEMLKRSKDGRLGTCPKTLGMIRWPQCRKQSSLEFGRASVKRNYGSRDQFLVVALMVSNLSKWVCE